MIAASSGTPAGAQTSVLWLVASSAIFTIGELYVSPVGLSFVTNAAPARMVSMMMGVWYLSSFVGNYTTGYLGTFYEKMPHTEYFLLLAVIGVVAGVVLLAIRRPLRGLRGTGLATAQKDS
jgi:POT family proton-dependent oligopeptide transporter